MKRPLDWIYGIRVHLVCWAVWITYEVLTTGVIAGRFSHYLFYMLFYPLHICLFYVHALLVMPVLRRLRVARIWQLPVLMVLELAVYILISMLLNQFIQYMGATKSLVVYNLAFFVSVFWRGMLFMLTATGYYYGMAYLRNTRLAMIRDLENERLKLKVVQTEMDLLRSQINPHLLYNMLSFVNYAAKRNPLLAEEATQRLTSVLRFAMDKSHGGYVDLCDELAQVENMIRLQQLRFADGVFVTLSVALNGKSARIIPIILLTLVENIFKHGELRMAGSPAVIKVQFCGDNLEFHSVNLVREAPLHGRLKDSGTGLGNIRSRLEIFYPNRYELVYGKEGDIFRSYLRLALSPAELSARD